MEGAAPRQRVPGRSHRARRRLSRSRLTRRRVAAASLAGAAALAARALWIEPRRIVVRRRDLRLPRWPAALDGLTIAVVSDLHTGGPHVDPEVVGRVTRRVNAAAPDLVALLGDFVDAEAVLSRPVDPREVAARLGTLTAPRGVFAVLGNHDWREGGGPVARALRGAGVRVLENQAAAAGDGLWWWAWPTRSRGGPTRRGRSRTCRGARRCWR